MEDEQCINSLVNENATLKNNVENLDRLLQESDRRHNDLIEWEKVTVRNAGVESDQRLAQTLEDTKKNPSLIRLKPSII